MDSLQTLKFFSFLFILSACSSFKKSYPTKSASKSDYSINHLLEGNFINLKSGRHTFGPRVHIDEREVGFIKVKGYKFQQTEVTQLQWYLVMNNNPSYYKQNTHCKDHLTIDTEILCPNNPVESISYNDVQLFIKKLNKLTKSNYKLPTENQWEYSVTKENLHINKLGEKESEKYANFSNNHKKTISVTKLKPLTNGLYHTAGNVWEFTSTIKDSLVITKGGGWNSKYDHLRSNYRGKTPKDLKSRDLGFRLVK